MQMKQLIPVILMAVLLSACTGTDFIDDPAIPERLVISPRIDSLEVGQTVQFEAAYYDEFGKEKPAAIGWQSTNPSIVSISQNGLATGVSNGPVKIIAAANNIADTLVLNTTGVTNSSGGRMGNFQNAGNHYHSSGGVRLEQLPDGSLQLIFESDFSTSPGPSLYVLLANHKNGAYAVTPGGNAISGASAQITPARLTSFSGARTYAVPAGISTGDYKYVVLYCTLGPVFGFAELK
jgi:hypothetical protein